MRTPHEAQAKVSHPANCLDALMPLDLVMPPPDPGFEISLASSGMSQGLAQTEGPQIRPRAYVRVGAAQIGAQWRNIDSPQAGGVAALFLKLDGKLGPNRFEAIAAYRIRTGIKQPHDSRAWEFGAAATRHMGRLVMRIGAEYSPDDFGSGRSLYIESGATFELDRSTAVSAGAGRRERDRDPDYTSFNAGISKRLREGLTIEARYYRTDRSELGARFGERMVVAAHLAL